MDEASKRVHGVLNELQKKQDDFKLDAAIKIGGGAVVGLSFGILTKRFMKIRKSVIGGALVGAGMSIERYSQQLSAPYVDPPTCEIALSPRRYFADTWKESFPDTISAAVKSMSAPAEPVSCQQTLSTVVEEITTIQVVEEIVEETPVAEELPICEEIPVVEEISLVEEIPVCEEILVVENAEPVILAEEPVLDESPVSIMDAIAHEVKAGITEIATVVENTAVEVDIVAKNVEKAAEIVEETAEKVTDLVEEMCEKIEALAEEVEVIAEKIEEVAEVVKEASA